MMSPRLELRPTWQRPRPPAHRLRADAWLGLAFVLGAVVVTLLINSTGMVAFESAPSLAEQIGWGVALTAPLTLRRMFPATVTALVAALFIAAQVRQVADTLIPSIVLFLAIYSLGAWGRDRRVAFWTRLAVIVAMFVWLTIAMVDNLRGPDASFESAGPLDPVLAMSLYSFGVNLLFFLSAYFFGNMAWESARRQDALALQGHELEQSQEENARQAVVAERLRIARDLHDVVAHHVSVMGVQAAAARTVLDRDRDQASQSLAAVESTARSAVGELNDLLGVLRSEPDRQESVEPRTANSDRAASPGLDQIPQLAETMSTAALEVDYTQHGDPRPVPRVVELSAYRVVQEALTNTVKHASATKAEVRVRYLDQEFEVEVTDNGTGGLRPHADQAATSKLGLIGMRERVTLHGGSLEAGPRPAGGYRVRATFPVDRGDPADHHPRSATVSEPVETT